MQSELSRLDRIEALVERNSQQIQKLTEDIDKQREEAKQQREEAEKQRQEAKELGLKFQFYQQSTSAIVNLAFSLIASVTVSVFITTILKR
jgi:predicted ribosome quality control (RQC) complex YloA/Tae2 family protein